MPNKTSEPINDPAGNLLAQLNRCSCPLRGVRATGALITERDPLCHLPVFAPLRPTNDRIHTSSLLPENPAGFSDIILNGDQRARWDIQN